MSNHLFSLLLLGFIGFALSDQNGFDASVITEIFGLSPSSTPTFPPSTTSCCGARPPDLPNEWVVQSDETYSEQTTKVIDIFWRSEPLVNDPTLTKRFPSLQTLHPGATLGSHVPLTTIATPIPPSSRLETELLILGKVDWTANQKMFLQKCTAFSEDTAWNPILCYPPFLPSWMRPTRSARGPWTSAAASREMLISSSSRFEVNSRNNIMRMKYRIISYLEFVATWNAKISVSSSPADTFQSQVRPETLP